MIVGLFFALIFAVLYLIACGTKKKPPGYKQVNREDTVIRRYTLSGNIEWCYHSFFFQGELRIEQVAVERVHHSKGRVIEKWKITIVFFPESLLRESLARRRAACEVAEENEIQETRRRASGARHVARWEVEDSVEEIKETNKRNQKIRPENIEILKQ